MHKELNHLDSFLIKGFVFTLAKSQMRVAQKVHFDVMGFQRDAPFRFFHAGVDFFSRAKALQRLARRINNSKN